MPGAHGQTIDIYIGRIKAVEQHDTLNSPGIKPAHDSQRIGKAGAQLDRERHGHDLAHLSRYIEVRTLYLLRGKARIRRQDEYVQLDCRSPCLLDRPCKGDPFARMNAMDTGDHGYRAAVPHLSNQIEILRERMLRHVPAHVVAGFRIIAVTVQPGSLVQNLLFENGLEHDGARSGLFGFDDVTQRRSETPSCP